MTRLKAEGRRLKVFSICLLLALPLFSQAPTDPPPGHDISKVDPAPLGGAIAIPPPEREKKRLKKYEMPELSGARQAIGSQLINGRLPKPVLDYLVSNGAVDQRISFFEGGLVVVRLAGAGGVVQKRVIIPDDALKNYLQSTTPEALQAIRDSDLTPPNEGRSSLLRIYAEDGTAVERVFDPLAAHPRKLDLQISPLQDLLRAISEDRTVTNTVAGYEPKVGDELVGDDRKTWRVERIIKDSGVVQLRCTSQPTVMYVAKKDLHNYFIGRAR